MATHAPITGAPTRAPVSHYSVEYLSRFCAEHGIAESRFGRNAVNDPRLIDDMRSHRRPGPSVRTRIAAYIAWIESGEVPPCAR